MINKTFVCLVFSTTCAKPEYFIGVSIHASCHLSASASKDVALKHLHYRPISAAFPGNIFPWFALAGVQVHLGSVGFSWDGGVHSGGWEAQPSLEHSGPPL